MIKRGANNWHDILKFALSYGDMFIVYDIIDKERVNATEILQQALNLDRINIVHYLLDIYDFDPKDIIITDEEYGLCDSRIFLDNHYK